jgi:hypothetical protein
MKHMKGHEGRPPIFNNFMIFMLSMVNPHSLHLSS